MAKIEWKGLEEYEKRLRALSQEEKRDLIPPAVYSAADIVADEIRREAEQLPTAVGHGSPERMLPGVTPRQKRDLLKGLGIAQMRDDNGFVNVKIGFDGYNSIKTKLYPKGQPNAMIARSIVRGTSFLSPNPFVERAVKKARKRAVEKMGAVISEKIESIMK